MQTYTNALLEAHTCTHLAASHGPPSLRTPNVGLHGHTQLQPVPHDEATGRGAERTCVAVVQPIRSREVALIAFSTPVCVAVHVWGEHKHENNQETTPQRRMWCMVCETSALCVCSVFCVCVAGIAAHGKEAAPRRVFTKAHTRRTPYTCTVWVTKHDPAQDKSMELCEVYLGNGTLALGICDKLAIVVCVVVTAPKLAIVLAVTATGEFRPVDKFCTKCPIVPARIHKRGSRSI